MTKPNLQPDDLISVARCAALLGIFRQQLGKESHRQGFPIHHVAGKRLCRPAEVAKWREGEIRIRKTMPILARPAAVAMPQWAINERQPATAPGIFIGVADVQAAPGDSPYSAAVWLPPELLKELTPADFQGIHAALSAGIFFAVENASLARGESLKLQATVGYFDDLLEDVWGGPLDRALRLTITAWAAGRWPGRAVTLLQAKGAQ